MKSLRDITFLLLIVLIISGCSIVGEKTEGYILKVEKGKVLFAENISYEEYSAMKDLSSDELTNIEPVPHLIYLTYSKTGDLAQGDKVSVTISGDVETSFPAKAKASKIKKYESNH